MIYAPITAVARRQVGGVSRRRCHAARRDRRRSLADLDDLGRRRSDNAKKYIEEQPLRWQSDQRPRGRRDRDTVGDLLRDPAGPAVKPMMRIADIVALLLLAILGALTALRLKREIAAVQSRWVVVWAMPDRYTASARVHLQAFLLDDGPDVALSPARKSKYSSRSLP